MSDRVINQHINFDMDRRQFFGRFALGVGGVALTTLFQSHAAQGVSPFAGVLEGTHIPARAKRIIYLFMSGGPSQLDLFDYKPKLSEMNGQDLPESIRNGQRLTTMTSNQARLPMAGSIFKFARQGQSGQWMSELLPYTAKVADDLC